jgi:phosphatidylserine decarboxylase
MTIAREGWGLIAAPSLATLAAGALGFQWVAAVAAVLALFTAFFFRDPERVSDAAASVLVSPADGRVVHVGPAPEDNPLGSGAQQISIFLSIFDVHVNRSPMSGRIVAVDYRKGEFLPAFDHDASHRNERNEVVLERDGVRVAFRQIAGLIARRIVFRGEVGEEVARGQRVGLIKFGSRVDVFTPPGTRIPVSRGDRVRAGVSAIGELGS